MITSFEANIGSAKGPQANNESPSGSEEDAIDQPPAPFADMSSVMVTAALEEFGIGWRGFVS